VEVKLLQTVANLRTKFFCVLLILYTLFLLRKPQRVVLVDHVGLLKYLRFRLCQDLDCKVFERQVRQHVALAKSLNYAIHLGQSTADRRQLSPAIALTKALGESI
jgi:hypothetical protein